MAAPLAIGLLGWYACVRNGVEVLAVRYLTFLPGWATLAKGPVPLFWPLPILAAFAFARKEWSILYRLAVGAGLCFISPMCCRGYCRPAENPNLFRRFFLEHTCSAFHLTGISMCSHRGTT